MTPALIRRSARSRCRRAAGRERERERPSREPLLQRRSAERTDRCGQPDQRRIGVANVVPKRIRDNAGEGRDRDRAERRRGRLVRRECREQEQEQRHDHDPAADAEEGAEDAGDQTDRNQPTEERAGHPAIVGTAYAASTTASCAAAGTRSLHDTNSAATAAPATGRAQWSAVYPRAVTSCRFAPAALFLAAALAPAAAAARTAAAPAPPQPAVYTLRGDPRMCASPSCGGFWARRVNSRLATCLDGARRASCYVASVDLSALTTDGRRRAQPVLSTGRTLVEGVLARLSSGFPQLARLVTARVWLTAGPGHEPGIVYRVVDTGLRCIRAPCFSLRATELNGVRSVTLSGLDLAHGGIAPATIALAHAALAHDGVLVSGAIHPVGKTGRDSGRTFVATELWLPA